MQSVDASRSSTELVNKHISTDLFLSSLFVTNK